MLRVRSCCVAGNPQSAAYLHPRALVNHNVATVVWTLAATSLRHSCHLADRHSAMAGRPFLRRILPQVDDFGQRAAVSQQECKSDPVKSENIPELNLLISKDFTNLDKSPSKLPGFLPAARVTGAASDASAAVSGRAHERNQQSRLRLRTFDATARTGKGEPSARRRTASWQTTPTPGDQRVITGR